MPVQEFTELGESSFRDQGHRSDCFLVAWAKARVRVLALQGLYHYCGGHSSSLSLLRSGQDLPEENALRPGKPEGARRGRGQAPPGGREPVLRATALHQQHGPRGPH